LNKKFLSSIVFVPHPYGLFHSSRRLSGNFSIRLISNSFHFNTKALKETEKPEISQFFLLIALCLKEEKEWVV